MLNIRNYPIEVSNFNYQLFFYSGMYDRICEMTQKAKEKYLMCTAILTFAFVPIVQLITL